MFLRRLITTTSMLCALTLPAGAAVLDISITFDSYPIDISWTVEDLFGSEFGSGGGYKSALADQTITSSINLSAGDYVFEIADNYGDGLCCNEGAGSFALSLDNTVFFTSHGQFGSSESVGFVVSAVSTVPLPAGGLLLLSGFVGLTTQKRRKKLAA